MVAHGGTGQKARTPQIQPGPQRWPSNCGGSRNQRRTSMPCSLVAVLATDKIRQPLLARAVTTAAWTFASMCQVSSTVVSVDEVPREVAVGTLARSAVRAFVVRESISPRTSNPSAAR
jgi:hypothetical protein